MKHVYVLGIYKTVRQREYNFIDAPFIGVIAWAIAVVVEAVVTEKLLRVNVLSPFLELSRRLLPEGLGT